MVAVSVVAGGFRPIWRVVPKSKGRPSCDDRPEYILALPWATGSAGGPWLSLRRLVRMSR